jgi:methionyl-tRNA synthetase
MRAVTAEPSPSSASTPQPSSAPSSESSPGNEASDRISIDDFARVEMRVGTVRVAERVPNADRLLRLEVEVGEPTPRQIVAGIAAYYSPEELVGRRIVVVANLQPRKLRGLESNGMLLAASAEGDRPVLVTVTEDVPDGARLR